MKRILLKISGEALSDESGSISSSKADALAKKIVTLHKIYEIIIVFGGGNIYRGSKLISEGVDPADSHNMSMLSTVFNAVTMKNFLEKNNKKICIMDALHVEFLETFNAIKARNIIQEGVILICSSGSGSPFFTTDTGGVLRALELHCDAMIKLTKVDGIYSGDPIKDPQAQKIEHISYNDFISQNLQVLDQTAVIMARDNNLPVYLTNLEDENFWQEGIRDSFSGSILR